MGLKSIMSPSLGTVVKTNVLTFLAGIIGGVMFAGTLGSLVTLLQVGFVVTVVGMIGLSAYRFMNRGGSTNTDDTDSDPIAEFEDL